MVAATLLWGATFVAIRDSVARISPVTLVWGRFTLAALLLGLVHVVRGQRPTRAELAGGAVAGTLGGAGYLLQAIGLTRTSAGSSAFLTFAGTMLAAWLAWPLLRQRPSGRLVIGLVLALVGSALLTLRSGLQPGVGELWTLLGALGFALQVVALGRVAPGSRPLTLALVQAAAIAIVLAPWSAAGLGTLGALRGADAMRFAYLALAGSTIAPALQILAQREVEPGRIALLFALEPVFALLFALTLGAEHFALRWWIGAALCLSGVVWVEWGALRAPASSRPASA
jgi:drug/metabolite transporter (DMT)-like permease